ncbi:hypothetical protein PISMIDRAFT_555800, partial [Pisolithus microcarpus 441]
MLMGSTAQGGICTFGIGGVLHVEGTLVETANRRNILHHEVLLYYKKKCIKRYQPSTMIRKAILDRKKNVGQQKYSCIQTKENEKDLRQNGTGKYTMRSEERVFVANEQLCSSAWSYRTGKRIKSSLRRRLWKLLLTDGKARTT